MKRTTAGVLYTLGSLLLISPPLLAKQADSTEKLRALQIQHENLKAKANLEASHFLRQIDEGNVFAMIQLGDHIMRSPQLRNKKQAEYWYKRALDAGHPAASSRLSELEQLH